MICKCTQKNLSCSNPAKGKKKIYFTSYSQSISKFFKFYIQNPDDLGLFYIHDIQSLRLKLTKAFCQCNYTIKERKEPFQRQYLLFKFETIAASLRTPEIPLLQIRDSITKKGKTQALIKFTPYCAHYVAKTQLWNG